MNERVLRAKYLDWCSARIAERFLELTPDEIYELAQRAPPVTASAGAPSASGEPPASGAPERLESFRRVVARVTEVLAATIALPEFEDWRVEYGRSPGRYDDEMLGFWKEAL